MSDILTVDNLRVSFKSKGRTVFDKPTVKEVLHGVSFTMEEGKILGLIGESGSGKSTIAKSILKMVPYEGNIELYGNKAAMVFQDPYSCLDPSKKIGFLFEEAAYLSGIKDKEERRKKSVEMIELIGLSQEHLNRLPSELSGGQRQRVCTCLALIGEPKLLIADEMVSALDVTIQAQILSLLKELQKTLNLSIIFISHDLRVVYNLCDSMIVLKDGEIVESGEPKVIYENPAHPYTRELIDSALLTI